MTISDAAFAQWLLSDAPRVVLAEMKFAYELAGAPAEGTIYLADRPYVTGPAENPPNMPYRDAIVGVPAIRRALDIPSLGGIGRLSYSELVLDNADGSLDFLLDLIVDGREITFLVGDPSWDRADFRTVHVMTVEYIEAVDERRLAVNMVDKRLRLDREIKGNAVGGSGPNATKYLPLLWGSHQNVAPLLYDAAALQYAVLSNYSAETHVVDVRDAGVSLTTDADMWSATSANTTVDAGTDTFQKVAHGLEVNDVMFFYEPGVVIDNFYEYVAPFAGMTARPYWVKTVPTADTFTLSATKGGATLDITSATWTASATLGVRRQRWYDDTINTGRIELSTTPAGTITLDVRANATYTGSPYALAKYLVETYGGVVAADIDSAAFTAADTALDAKITIGYMNLAVTERRNLLEVLSELVDAAFGWYGTTFDGKITCGLLDPSGLASATATRTITLDQAIGDVSCRNIAPTISRVNVQYDLNVATQTDGLATSLTPEERALYAEPFRKVQRSTAPSGTAYATNPGLYHTMETEGAPKKMASMNSRTFGSDAAAPISSAANEIVADRAPHLRIYRTMVTPELYDANIGEVVVLTLPRFGCDTGRKCRIVAIELDLVQWRVSLELLAHVTPDYATASYY